MKLIFFNLLDSELYIKLEDEISFYFTLFLYNFEI